MKLYNTKNPWVFGRLFLMDPKECVHRRTSSSSNHVPFSFFLSTGFTFRIFVNKSQATNLFLLVLLWYRILGHVQILIPVPPLSFEFHVSYSSRSLILPSRPFYIALHCLLPIFYFHVKNPLQVPRNSIQTIVRYINKVYNYINYKTC
jgi:hypothetical protein